MGMGTSALEGAACGIPTVLVDACHRIFPRSYKFKWLFESHEYSLGRFIDNSITDWYGHTIEEMIAAISDPINRLELSKKTKKYVIANHSIQSTWDKLIHLEPALCLDVVKNYTIRSWSSMQSILSHYQSIRKLIPAEGIKKIINALST